MPASSSTTRQATALAGHSAPKVLDLFCGCGGISLGFQRAGFHIVGGIESSPEAAMTHAINFHPGLDEAARRPFAKARDIRETDPHALLAELGETGPIDVIVGGPPCQAYARVGRAKLREVMAHPDAFTQDDRGNLYLHYLRFVAALRPQALLMENVPDILNYGGKNIAEEIADNLEEIGYSVRYTLLNAANFGVPQTRERFFMLARRGDLGEIAGSPFPSPTHRVANLPVGYLGTRATATRLSRAGAQGLLDCGEQSRLRRFAALPSFTDTELPEAVTAREAMSDLPPIRAHLDGTMARGARRFTVPVSYRESEPVSPYANEMRTWPGFESRGAIFDHLIRSCPRDYPIFRNMRPGDQYPEAYAVAERLFGEELARRRAEGQVVEVGSATWHELRGKIVPPYDVGKFPNKWRKLEPDRPARTLMAHLGKDSYSHIHYDDGEARTISVREAARLQSFPDGFQFSGTMNPALRQIGNAVPPKIAWALASAVRCLIAATPEAKSTQPGTEDQ